MDPSPRPFLPLDDEEAADASRTGGKAAALARASAAGLRVAAGCVVPTEATRGSPEDVVERLAPHLDDLRSSCGGDGTEVIVRSSSPAEDQAGSAMAGRFESVGGVATDDDLRRAIAEVVRSRDRVAEEEDAEPALALLVQRSVEAVAGGVMFTIDPVTSDPSRIVISASSEGPDALVSGTVVGTTYVVDPDGDMVEREDGDGGADLDPGRLRELAELAGRLEEVFGAPQDVEWAVDPSGELWLLQSRPITVVREFPLDPDGPFREELPILGPGPVAETFPVALHALERDLWVPPLHEALRRVFRIVATSSEADIERSPIVTTVEGHVVVDLDLFGVSEREGPWWSALDPRPRIRRLRAAWRIGRLRASLLAVGRAVVDATDERLGHVPPLAELSERQLIGLLERSSDLLRSLHGHEVLVGLLIDEEAPGLSGPSVALRVLATARRDGWDDAEIIRRHPVVLALAPPCITERPELPETPGELPPRPISGNDADEIMVLREALRIRIRWVQELSARAALDIGRRLAADGMLTDPLAVRTLRRDEVRAAVEQRADLVDIDAPGRRPSGAPVPAEFQLHDGRAVPVAAGGSPGGTGAGGGQGEGPARVGGDPQPGDVLVVRTLDPALGARVGELAGLVSETGSALSHVAILAREAGVPTAVGVADATSRFNDGDHLLVDGDSGRVERKEQ